MSILRRLTAPGGQGRAMAANSGWLLLDSIYARLLGLGVAVILARLLGPGDYGLLGMALAYAGMFAAVSGGSLQVLVVRELVRRPDSEAAILGSALALRLILCLGGAGLMLAGLLLPSLGRPGMALVCLVICLGWPMAALRTTAGALFRSKLQERVNVRVKAACDTGVALGKAGAALRGLPVWVVAAVETLGSLVWAAALCRALPGGLAQARTWRPRRGEMALLWREGWPLLVWGSMTILYASVDQVMLGAMRGYAETGRYIAAVKVAHVPGVLPSLLLPSLFPYLLRLRDQDQALYHHRLDQLYTGLTWLALAIALCISLPAGFIMTLLYGQDYAQTSTALAIAAWGNVFSFQGQARGQWIMAEGLQRYTMAYAGCGLVVNIAANLALIPLYGATGAAAGTLLSQFVGVVIAPLFFRATRPSSLALLRAFLPPGPGMLR